MGILSTIFGGEPPSGAELWNDQQERNRTATILGVFPNHTARQIAQRMDTCPNNPANGGDGFDIGDGTWTDRR